MQRILSVSALLSLAFATKAQADSDGYFCVGKDYIAYQFGLGPAPDSPHRLTIIRFDHAGFSQPVLVELPQFQVHGMVCAESVIRIAAFDTIHTVRLDTERRPIGLVTSEPIAVRGQLPREFAGQRNLAGLSRAARSFETERLRLGRSTTGHTFELHITPKQGTPACVTNVVTTLKELDSRGATVANILVFSGPGYRECGEQDARRELPSVPPRSRSHASIKVLTN